MNGHQWEQIIRKYLPNLKVFQLKMCLRVSGEKHRKELLSSFHTPFWLKEHQWFIQYHYDPDGRSNMICLYTLPYSFSRLEILFPVAVESTCSRDVDYSSFDQVQHLNYRFNSVNELTVSDLHFPNVTSLSITLPANNHLLQLIPKLNQLTSLEVSRSKNMSDDDAQSQLQNILDRIPQLYSLKFNVWSAAKLTPIVLKTRGIQRVHLRGYDWWFNHEECVILSQSSLGEHCEVLFINVQNRMNILYLIHSMYRHLRTLIVQSRDDNHIYYSSSVNDKYVQWLRENLPSTCSIQRDIRFIHCIRIWIHF